MLSSFTPRVHQKPLVSDRNVALVDKTSCQQLRQQQRGLRARLLAGVLAPHKLVPPSDLPWGIHPTWEPAYQRLHGLAQSPEVWLDSLLELEARVVALAGQTRMSSEQALEALLLQSETNAGFVGVYHLPPKLHDVRQWMTILASCRTLYDPMFARCQHGSQSHRLQWYVVCRDFADNPYNYYPATTPAELYRSLGDAEAVAHLDWSQTPWASEAEREGVFPLWDPLFDSYQHNFTSPEFLRSVLDEFYILRAG
mgnify:CR=1 FL=1